jgi:hypothetical protein
MRLLWVTTSLVVMSTGCGRVAATGGEEDGGGDAGVAPPPSEGGIVVPIGPDAVAPPAPPQPPPPQPPAPPPPPTVTCAGAPSYPFGTGPGMMPASAGGVVDACPPQAAGCSIDQAKCGSESTCLPMAQNQGSRWDFRMRRLEMKAPPSLSTSFVQGAVITHNVDLNAKTCGDNGLGSLSWLLRFDAAAKTLETGGAAMSADPFGAGFCFDRQTVDSFSLAPQTVCATQTSDYFTSGTIPSLSIPIFLNGDSNNVFVLPLRQVQFGQVHVSANDACIGRFNAAALASDCSDDPNTCDKWATDGSVAGFITLEDADKVMVQDLSETLCVLLAGVSRDPLTRGCPRDASGHIVPKGDFCSTSGKVGDCADSDWFGATFAASAAKVNDGTGTPACQ